MEFIPINTTQNIDLEYKMASIGDRILAFAIDIIILFFWTFSTIYLINKLDLDFNWITITTIVLPSTFYSLLSELLLGGQTLGKMALKIKVTPLDGAELSLGTCLIRWALRLVDIWTNMGSIAVISILVSKKGQRLGDLATNTTVVKLSQRNLFEETNYMEVPTGYMSVYVQAAMLSDDDASTIKEVLNFTESQNKKGFSPEHHPMQVKLQNALKEKLGIEKIHSSPKLFLEELLRDFNHIHQ